MANIAFSEITNTQVSKYKDPYIDNKSRPPYSATTSLYDHDYTKSPLVVDQVLSEKHLVNERYIDDYQKNRLNANSYETTKLYTMHRKIANNPILQDHDNMTKPIIKEEQDQFKNIKPDNPPTNPPNEKPQGQFSSKLIKKPYADLINESAKQIDKINHMLEEHKKKKNSRMAASQTNFSNKGSLNLEQSPSIKENEKINPSYDISEKKNLSQSTQLNKDYLASEVDHMLSEARNREKKTSGIGNQSHSANKKIDFEVERQNNFDSVPHPTDTKQTNKFFSEGAMTKEPQEQMKPKTSDYRALDNQGWNYYSARENPKPYDSDVYDLSKAYKQNDRLGATQQHMDNPYLGRDVVVIQNENPLSLRQENIPIEKPKIDRNISEEKVHPKSSGLPAHSKIGATQPNRFNHEKKSSNSRMVNIYAQDRKSKDSNIEKNYNKKTVSKDIINQIPNQKSMYTPNENKDSPITPKTRFHTDENLPRNKNPSSARGIAEGIEDYHRSEGTDQSLENDNSSNLKIKNMKAQGPMHFFVKIIEESSTAASPIVSPISAKDSLRKKNSVGLQNSTLRSPMNQTKSPDSLQNEKKIRIYSPSVDMKSSSKNDIGKNQPDEKKEQNQYNKKKSDSKLYPKNRNLSPERKKLAIMETNLKQIKDEKYLIKHNSTDSPNSKSHVKNSKRSSSPTKKLEFLGFQDYVKFIATHAQQRRLLQENPSSSSQEVKPIDNNVDNHNRFNVDYRKSRSKSATSTANNHPSHKKARLDTQITEEKSENASDGYRHKDHDEQQQQHQVQQLPYENNSSPMANEQARNIESQQNQMSSYPPINPQYLSTNNPKQNYDSLIQSLRMRQEYLNRKNIEPKKEVVEEKVKRVESIDTKPSEINIYDRANLWLNAKYNKIDQQVVQKNEEIMKNCTFKPALLTGNSHNNTSSVYAIVSPKSTKKILKKSTDNGSELTYKSGYHGIGHATADKTYSKIFKQKKNYISEREQANISF